MITQWTIRRTSPIAPNSTARWAILEPDEFDGTREIITAGNLNFLLGEFADLVLREFDGIAKEVTEA